MQFHADPAELLSMLPAWTEDLPVHLAAERFFPTYKAIAVKNGDLDRAMSELDHIDRVLVCLKPVAAPADSSVEFHEMNRGCFLITLGYDVSEGLREGAFSADTDDLAELKAWRKILARAKASMRRGAFAVNPRTGAKQAMRNHYFTEGARTLARQGVPMLAMAGSNRYEFIDE